MATRALNNTAHIKLDVKRKDSGNEVADVLGETTKKKS